MRAVYPGSFNPPTIGHIAIVNSAINHFGISELHLAISTVALGKEKLTVPSVADRVEILRRSLNQIPEASVLETRKQLIADIAEGYDLVILGADKWAQLHDLSFYKDKEHMAQCLRRLPKLAVAPRNGIAVPQEILLTVPEEINSISSSQVRRGKFEWMTKEAYEIGKDRGFWGIS